ncbi:MAG: hypothetical protein AABY22_01540 [Nanoarchaeota archaeon]
MATKEEWDDFAKKIIPQLKQMGYIEEDKPRINWLPLALIILGLLLAGAIYYGIQKDAFKSEFNQEIEPNISVNTANQYDFNPSISNPVNNQYETKNNFTIYVNNFITPV